MYVPQDCGVKALRKRARQTRLISRAYNSCAKLHGHIERANKTGCPLEQQKARAELFLLKYLRAKYVEEFRDASSAEFRQLDEAIVLYGEDLSLSEVS
jgi:hypothetical protein